MARLIHSIVVKGLLSGLCGFLVSGALAPTVGRAFSCSDFSTSWTDGASCGGVGSSWGSNIFFGGANTLNANSWSSVTTTARGLNSSGAIVSGCFVVDSDQNPSFFQADTSGCNTAVTHYVYNVY